MQHFAMQKHSKTSNVPFPRPCGATGNDAQKLHAITFVHFRGAALMHEVLYQVAFETDGLKLAGFICESQYILFENRITPGKAGFPTNGRSGTEKTQPC